MQIILVAKEMDPDFLSHCNETVLHIAGTGNTPMQINCTGVFSDKTIKMGANFGPPVC